MFHYREALYLMQQGQSGRAIARAELMGRYKAGRVPAVLSIDNLKAAITRACYHGPQVQHSYADCAEGCGFIIAPCPLADPQKKRRVEAGVKYVKNSFAPPRTFRDLVDARSESFSVSSFLCSSSMPDNPIPKENRDIKTFQQFT